MINLYRVGSWVVGTEFYNRGNHLPDILTYSTVGIWIIGNRRVGKTSLLRTAECQAANSNLYLPLFWDMQGDTSEAQLIESLLEAVENAQWSEVDQRWPSIELPENAAGINQALRRVTAQVKNLYHCRLLLLCDEIEGLNQLGQQEPHVLSELRRVMQQHPAIRTVLTSTRRLSRLYAIQQQQDTSLFLEGFEPRYLTNFDDETANQVICCTQSAHPLTVSEALQAQIRFFSGNHPLILQKVCQQLFDTSIGTLRPFAQNDFILDDQLSGTFQQDFDSLTPDEAKLLLFINSQEISYEQIEQTFSQFSQSGLRRMLHDLTQLGFLRLIDNLYQAGSIPLGEWLAAGPTHHTPQGGVTNRVMREVAQERVASLQRQLIACMRHLGELELRQAKQGLETPPHIITEIEAYKQKIVDIEAELAELGENITLVQPPQSE
jgi:hypothetical protein